MKQTSLILFLFLTASFFAKAQSTIDSSYVNIPNVFTPNGDQLNQFFTIDDRLVGTTFDVFDRWGQRVYHSDDYKNNWDGDDLPSGVYFYLLNGGECIVEKKGTLTILR